MTAKTPAQRQRDSRHRRRLEGARLLSGVLSPAASRQLAKWTEKTGLDALEVVNRLLERSRPSRAKA
jgi:hypothetical protein